MRELDDPNQDCPPRFEVSGAAVDNVALNRRIFRRMPRLQVYLPDDLYAELKDRNLPASELLQVAVRAEVERRDALDATDAYLSDLTAELGEPTARDQARARAIVRRIEAGRRSKAG